MILNRVDPRHDLATLTPEQPDDLWTLRRIISKGDLVAAESSRVVKETSEYARPEKERVKVTVTVEVEQAKLDSTLSRLRITGKIVDISNDILSKNAFHSLTISEGKRISLRKPSGFSNVQLNLINGSKAERESYAIVALDTRDAGLGVVKGTHLQILPTVESGAAGKMYQDSKIKPSNYFQKVGDALAIICPRGAPVFVLGPGNVKYAFANYINQNRKDFASATALEGLDVAGEDGVYVAIRNQNLQNAIGEGRLARASKIIQEVMRRISLSDPRIALAFKDNMSAAMRGATESLLLSEKIFSQKDVEEDSIVKLLNTVEEYRGETFLLDSSTDLGEQTNSLGGVVSLLRFRPRD